MIKVEGVTKRYARFTAVDNVSFEVAKGQIVGFLGPNGAGKTTTMRILTCFQPPSEGKASVAGFDVVEQPMEVKRRIGYLPETPPLYPELTVGDYLAFCAELRGFGGAKRLVQVGKVMELAGDLFRQFEEKVPTPRLNQFIQAVTAGHPPPVIQGKQLKVYYAAQVAQRPPTFQFTVNRPKDIPDHYIRYMTNELREAFGLRVPMRLLFKPRPGH